MSLLDPCTSCPHNPNMDMAKKCLNQALEEEFSEEEIKTKMIELFNDLSYESKNSLSRVFVLELERAEKFDLIRMLLI